MWRRRDSGSQGTVGLFVLLSSVLECFKVFRQGQGQGMGTWGFTRLCP